MTATLPASRVTPNASLRELARIEARRFARHPLFLTGSNAPSCHGHVASQQLPRAQVDGDQRSGADEGHHRAYRDCNSASAPALDGDSGWRGTNARNSARRSELDAAMSRCSWRGMVTDPLACTSGPPQSPAPHVQR